jgi:hypothetical protein
MSNASFVTYIDESGDEGFKFSKGSSTWFVLSCVITRKATDLATVKLVNDIRTALGRHPKKALHFADMRHEHRVPYIDKISKAQLRASAIFVHKPSLYEPAIFAEPHRLYRYCVRYLLERVSWFCRDHHDHAKYGGDGSTEIVFSNRTTMSYDEIRDYLDLLKRQSALLRCRVYWDAINSKRISALTPGKSMGLQIADAIASSCGYAVNASQYGYTESRYIAMLKPVIYCNSSGCYLGHGLKFWPKEADSVIAADTNLGWIREHFGG